MKHFFSNMTYMLKYSCKEAKGRYFFAVLNIVLNSVQPFFTLLMPKYIIDELTGQKRWETVCFYIAVLVAVNFAINLIRMLISYADGISSYRNNVRIAMNFAHKWANMDYCNLENSSVRDKFGQACENTHPGRFINATFTGFCTTLFQLAGYTYIVATLNPAVIAVILAIIAVTALISKHREKIGYEYQPVFMKFSRKFAYLFTAMIRFDYGKEIRINKASSWLEKKYVSEVGNYISAVDESQKKYLRLNITDTVLSFLQMLIVYGYASFKVIAGSITVGSFSVYLGAVTLFISSFSDFVSRINSFGYLSRYVDDFKSCIELATPVYLKKGVGKKPPLACGKQLTNGKQLIYGKHEIEFLNVSFKYPNTEKYVLKNISLKIEAGKKLSIVGYNGAGKTTFIKLLCRLYEPTEGRILYNGTDVSEIDYDEYRKLLGVVFQDYGLFSFTVEENIILDMEKDDEALFTAIEKSGLKNKISELSKGVETPLGKEFHADGIEFSGGEEQKLACARVYYKDPPIIIFDEPTASLDPVAENQLYQRFNDIIRGKTAIYISHRLASVRFCDNVAVFVNGEIVEYGTHSSLMRKNGVYAEMFNKQAMYYLEEAAV